MSDAVQVSRETLTDILELLHDSDLGEHDRIGNADCAIKVLLATAKPVDPFLQEMKQLIAERDALLVKVENKNLEMR